MWNLDDLAKLNDARVRESLLGEAVENPMPLCGLFLECLLELEYMRGRLPEDLFKQVMECVAKD